MLVMNSCFKELNLNVRERGKGERQEVPTGAVEAGEANAICRCSRSLQRGRETGSPVRMLPVPHLARYIISPPAQSRGMLHLTSGL